LARGAGLAGRAWPPRPPVWLRRERSDAMNLNLYPVLARRNSRAGRREQVLEGMWAGKGMKEIGADLGISPKTAEFHRARLYRLFGVQDPVSLCRRAMVIGLIRLPATHRRQRRQQRGTAEP
jgi:DNA-binding CsgD family transcriptional regulator